MPTHSTSIVTKLRVLYLDDEQGDLDNFQRHVNRFNSGMLDIDIGIESIELIITNQSQEAVDFFEDQPFDVVLCDHNMPQRRGLALIKDYLKPQAGNIVYVLYTGANLSPVIKTECENAGILYIEKTEQFSTLIEKVIDNLPMNLTTSPDPLHRFYKVLSKDIISEMKEIESVDPNFKISIGSKEYSPATLIREIKLCTEVGLTYLQSYFDGLKFFRK